MLENGDLFAGFSYGGKPVSVDDTPAPADRPPRGCGEVVINTAMVGYPEVLTDSSYNGQIVVMTYPHVGNYGIDPQWSEADFLRPGGASDLQPTGSGSDNGGGGIRPDIQVQGLVMHAGYHGRGGAESGRARLHGYLGGNGIPALTDIDTRALTLVIRGAGALYGAVVAAPPGYRRWDLPGWNISETWKERAAALVRAAKAADSDNRVAKLRRGSDAYITIENREESADTSETEPKIVLIDCGYKRNIIRHLRRLSKNIVIKTAADGAGAVLALKPALVVISNGPGDPAPLQAHIDMVKALIGKVPVFGICMGHQIISQALGARTYKMDFGHHGINHPVLCTDDNRVYVTSQNHEYAVHADSLVGSAKLWFSNLNDGSIEGIVDRERRVYSVQFHPEAAPGPRDCQWIFDHVWREAARTGTGAGEK